MVFCEDVIFLLHNLFDERNPNLNRTQKRRIFGDKAYRARAQEESRRLRWYIWTSAEAGDEKRVEPVLKLELP